MKSNKIIPKSIIDRRVLSFLSIILLFCSCNTKTDKEKLEERINKAYILSYLDVASNKYIKMKWDTVYAIIDSHVPAQLHLHGEGKSEEYGNHKFHVEAIYNYDRNRDAILYQSIHVYHKELGEIISTFEYGITHETIVTYEEFNKKVKIHNELIKERKDKVKLAYSNRTKVHFGMSYDDYINSNAEFRRNFIDGLIGDGSYEKTKARFVDRKFVGFEVHGHNIYDSNVCNNAHLSDERILNGSLRFYSVEKIYTCDLYNLKIFDQTDQSSGEEHMSIDVYWNEYAKIYK